MIRDAAIRSLLAALVGDVPRTPAPPVPASVSRTLADLIASHHDAAQAFATLNSLQDDTNVIDWANAGRDVCTSLHDLLAYRPADLAEASAKIDALAAGIEDDAEYLVASILANDIRRLAGEDRQ